VAVLINKAMIAANLLASPGEPKARSAKSLDQDMARREGCRGRPLLRPVDARRPRNASGTYPVKSQRDGTGKSD
jgi:hypothetical protein